MSNYVITWFYLDEADDRSKYMQISSENGSETFSNTYWRCVYCFYYSLILTNKDNFKYLFFTNLDGIPENVEGVNLKEFFKENNIECINQKLSIKTPRDWFGAWRNQFYVFDILKYLKETYNKDDSFMILDSDCLFIKDINPIFKDIRDNKLIDYKMSYLDTHNINGTTLIQMNEIYEKIYGEKKNFYYSGGEFFAGTHEAVSLISNEFEYLWKENFELYKNKQIKLTEEAHSLSVLYAKFGFQNSIANKYIKRIWTYRRSNFEESDSNLSIWHLPAEKEFAYRFLFNFIKKQKDITPDLFFRKLSLFAGFPKPNIYFKLREFVHTLIKHIKIKLKK